MSLLYDSSGKRKYLTMAERMAFLAAASRASADVESFCLTLAYTGIRLSEARALTKSRIDRFGGTIIVESLKKRRRGIYRAIPAPDELLAQLEMGYSAAQSDRARPNDTPIWNWSRTTAWRRVKGVMVNAGINGSQATPKGLRHAFGVAAVQSGVPLNMIRKWLGHTKLSTTAIYADAVGEEERRLAERFWRTF